MLMRRGLATLGALAALASSAQVALGQASVTVSGGATVPTGKYGDYAKTGYIGTVGAMFKVGTQGLSVGGQGFYGSNSHSDIDGDKTNLSGALGSVSYRVGDATKPGLFLVANVGFMRHSFSSDKYPSENEAKSGVAYGGGAGVMIPRGSLNFYVVARYLAGSIKWDSKTETTSFIPIQVGVSFPLGGNK